MTRADPMTTCHARALLLALMLTAAPAFAHEGHDHGADAQAVLPVLPAEQVGADAPRLAISQPPVELVAVQAGDSLLIDLDDYASNAPLAGLRVQVQIGSRLLDAGEVAPGRYRIARDLIGATGGTVKFVLHGAAHDAELGGLLPAAPAGSAIAAAPVVVPARFDRWTMLFGLVLAAASLAGGWTVDRRR